MFGDPVKNPKGWETQKIKSLGKVITGSTPSSSLNGMFGGTIPFITPGDLENDNEKPLRFVTEAGAIESRVVRKGSAMVCCIGATIGKMDIAKVKSAFNQQINSVEWYEIVNDVYGLYSLKFLKSEIVSKAKSTTLPILKKSLFEEIKIPVPPLSLQQQFAEIVNKTEGLKEKQKQSEQELENLFQSLMQKAFNGELVK